MSDKIRILCVGAGNMGSSHARAYHKLDQFEIVGIVTRSPESRGKLNEELNGGYAEFGDYAEALAETKPDAVVLATGSKLSPLRQLIEMVMALLMWLRYRDAINKQWVIKDAACQIQMVGPHTVMLAASKPNLELLMELGGTVPEIHVAGDCLEPFGIGAAMADGARVGRAL